MESAQRDICTSRSVDDPSLRRSEENVALEIPPQHYPIRLMDVVEVDESTSEDDNPCPLGFGREDDKPRVLDDENDDTNPTSTTVDYQNFFTSIKLGLVLPVRSMLEKGADIERLADDGLSPLAIAMKADQVEMVELLLEHGANANSRSRRMPFLVHASMRRNHGIRLLQMLLDHGANLNAISGPGQYNALHWAASEGRAEAVDFLISKGMDMETKCSEDRTPLMLAAERGHEHVINILWAQGADLEAESELGGTALFWAACGSSLLALVTLIAKGANVNHKDTKGHTALSLACQFGHTELVQALLDAGADIDTCDMKPKVATPLMAAAYEGHVDVVRTLIARGADVERLSPNGNNALDRALAEGREDAAKVLLEAMAGPNYPKDSVALQLALADTHAAIKGVMNTASIMYSYMEYGRHDEYAWMMWVLRQGGEVLKRAAMRKMLHAAMMDRNLSMLGALLDQGCDVDVHLASGHTCLSFAVGRRDIELINILLRAGADPNKPIPDADDHSYTPFDRAVIKLKDGHDTEIVDLLLATGRCRINKGRDVESTAFSYVLGKLKDWGSDVVDKLAQRMIDSVANIEEDRDDNGGTLLHVAVHHQRAYFVDYICWKGLHIDVAGAAGYTPFIQACQHSPKMALELILRGASINTKYRPNASALHAAATKDHADLLLRLLGLGLDIEECTLKGFTPLACALKWGREQAALALLSCGARTDWVTPDTKHSPLHYAARHGLEKVTNYLLHNSSSQCRDPNALDAEGWSPLHEACVNGTAAHVQVLLDAGADIESPLPNGDRPLHVALINENEPVALLLIEQGADIHAFASRNRSPLHIAADDNLPRVVEELLKRGLTTMIDHPDESTWTPLCVCGHVEIVEMLIKHGANVHYADKDGWTPLHQAVCNGDTNVAIALVEAGAKLDARTRDDGLSVLERAEDMENWPIVAKGVPVVGPKCLERAAKRRKQNLYIKRQREYDARRMAEAAEWRRVEEVERKEEEEREALERKKKEEEELDGLDGKFELVELGD